MIRRSYERDEERNEEDKRKEEEEFSSEEEIRECANERRRVYRERKGGRWKVCTYSETIEILSSIVRERESVHEV